MLNSSRALKRLLARNDLACVVEKADQLIDYTGRGIAPLMDMIKEQQELKESILADRVIGKAAALLAVKIGFKAVYGIVMSERALPVLERAGIEYGYSELVPQIINRDKSGICPMEVTVADCDDYEEAYLLLNNKLKMMNLNEVK